MGSLAGQRILLTGAAGGMGEILAEKLVHAGAKLALLDRNAKALNALVARLGHDSFAVSADVSSADGCRIAISAVWNTMEGVDCLINLAGISSFCCFEEEETAHMEKVLQVNLLAPMYLTHALLPEMIKRKRGRIVNIGSMFGSIGFAWFTTYSASKFGLRGFSQALRRELRDTGVSVSYIAPRAVRTTINNDAVMKMGEATGMNMDEPAYVAEKIFAAIEAEKKEVYIGFPESFFARLNGVFPNLVDGALADQNKTAKPFAKKSL
ncbi:MAG: SDR family oxidoreductase [Mariprofundaceae bacterium]|nr:SDR family oxidoreductase [Mariprofundaceae bacterium]